MIDIILFRICLWITYKAYNIQGTRLSIQVTLNFLEINIRIINKGYRIDVILLPICLSRIYKVYLKVHRVRVPRFLQDCHGHVRHSVAGAFEVSPGSFLKVRPRTALWYTRKKFCPSHHLCLAQPSPWKTLNWSTVSEAFLSHFYSLRQRPLLHLYTVFNIMPFAIS